MHIKAGAFLAEIHREALAAGGEHEDGVRFLHSLLDGKTACERTEIISVGVVGVECIAYPGIRTVGYLDIVIALVVLEKDVVLRLVQLYQAAFQYKDGVNRGDDIYFQLSDGENVFNMTVEKYLTDEYFKKPVFVVDYPADIKSFYMKQNPDGKTVAATDLLVPGIGEIIGCSEREWDLDKLTAAMNKRNMPLESYREYLDTRRFGSVPHSGFGLGLDRIVMYLTGVQNIRDTLLFPRSVGSI